MSSPDSPVIAGRYEVLRTLGQGAFGRTFLARDREGGGREVAIKMLDTQRVDSFKGFELFEREAAVLRSVRHHGVPEIYDSITADWEGRPAAFLVMEFIAGRSLADVIAERHHLDPVEATHILLELLGVLDYLHGRVPPILHRDIKPANVILRPDGFPTLVDFGAVRSAIHAPGHDGSTIVGTYGYMPYEQHMGQATPASDLYALAATFLHLLTGRAPPEFLNDAGRIAVPESLPGGARLRQVLTRMLQLSPAERYQSAREVRQALVGADVAPATGAALAPTTAVGGQLVAAPLALPPAPRPLTGEVEALYRQLAPSTWRYVNQGEDAGRPDIVAVGFLAFLSVVSIGIVPLIYWVRARARSRKVRQFLTQGTPAVAEIIGLQDEKDDLGVKIGRVRYEWQADGALHRDSDEVFATQSDRWRVGDQVQILYRPDRQYDSIVVG